MQKNKITQVLLFDRNNIERELISEILSNIGCKVTADVSQKDCLKLFGNIDYDLAIVDQDIKETDINICTAEE